MPGKYEPKRSFVATLPVKKKIILRAKKGGYKLVSGKTDQEYLLLISIQVHNII